MSPDNVNPHNYNLIISAMARKEKLLENIGQNLIESMNSPEIMRLERSDSFSEEGLVLADGQVLCDLSRIQLLALIRFFKAKCVTPQDQIKFIGRNAAEYLLLSCAYRSLKVRDILLLCDGIHYLPRDAPVMQQANRIVVRILDELVAEMRRYQVSEAEFYILRSLCLYDPEVHGCDKKNVCQTFQNVLEYYERENHPKEIGRTTGLMLLLPKVKSIANEIRQCAQLSSTFGVVELGPILEEVLSDNTTAHVTAQLVGMTLRSGEHHDGPELTDTPEKLDFEDIGDWIACVP